MRPSGPAVDAKKVDNQAVVPVAPKSGANNGHSESSKAASTSYQPSVFNRKAKVFWTVA